MASFVPATPINRPGDKVVEFSADKPIDAVLEETLEVKVGSPAKIRIEVQNGLFSVIQKLIYTPVKGKGVESLLISQEGYINVKFETVEDGFILHNQGNQSLKVIVETDKASTATGGVKFTDFGLEIKRDKAGMPLEFSAQNFRTLDLTPVMLNVTRVNLREALQLVK